MLVHLMKSYHLMAAFALVVDMTQHLVM